jgi:hypothetical protein
LCFGASVQALFGICVLVLGADLRPAATSFLFSLTATAAIRQFRQIANGSRGFLDYLTPERYIRIYPLTGYASGDLSRKASEPTPTAKLLAQTRVGGN